MDFSPSNSGREPASRMPPKWVPIKHAGPIRHFDACNTLAGAMAWIEAEGRPGFLRVVQTQLMIRAERIHGKLRLERKHAGSPETLERSVQAFDCEKDQRDKRG
jgi:hypothetical protein